MLQMIAKESELEAMRRELELARHEYEELY